MTLNTFKKPANLLILIIVVGLLARIAAALWMGNEVVELPGTFDQISYHKLALRLVSGHGFTFGELWWPITAADAPTAHWSYLYTLFLAAVYKVFGPVPLAARLLQVVLTGILQPYLAYLLARKVFDETAGLIAAGLTVVYSYFVYYSAALMTEPFYITAILAALYLTIRLAEAETEKEQNKLAVSLGLTVGVAVLLRQLFLLFTPILLIWMIWARYRRFGKFPVRSTLLIGIIVGAMILPFTLYNYSRFDRFVLLNTNSGYALFWANHPIYGTHFEPILPAEMGNYADLIPEEVRDLDEAALDQALLQRGIRFVLDDPVRYVQLSISRIPAYFMFWPSSASGMISNVARVSSFGILWPFMLYGLIYAAIRRTSSSRITSPITLLILFVITYSLIHLLSWSLIRYRLPVDAVLLIFAGLAIAHLSRKLIPEKLRSLVVQGSEN